MHVALALWGAFFALAALALLLHHGYSHGCCDADPDDAGSLARRESCAAVCYFQPSDVRNHETWVVACGALAGGLLLAAAWC